MDQLAERISKFKERLLDLSARNRLLNSNFKAKVYWPAQQLILLQ
jgi:hypothetical protein